MKKRRFLKEFIYAVFLLAAIILLFLWFTVKNNGRTEEQNRDYTADSARLKSVQIDDELNSPKSDQYLCVLCWRKSEGTCDHSTDASRNGKKFTV